MKRRVVVLSCLLGIVGGGAGAALASPHGGHQVCLMMANNQDYHNTQYLCVDEPVGDN